ncbi:MAG: hypothetical protein OXC91_02020 [Rhodobacteraceae bacterium]|nr:hypothetical protein [Paracoccaceae bacterium]
MVRLTDGRMMLRSEAMRRDDVVIAFGELGAVDKIIKRLGVRQISCPAEIGSMVDDVLRDNPDQARQYREGNKRVLSFLVGKVMTISNGRANPRMTNSILSAELNAEAA